MRSAPKWSQFYQSHEDGRFSISTTNLALFGSHHGGRVLDTYLWAKPAKVLIFDSVFSLGDRVQDGEAGAYYLHRVRVHSLPGWPPRMASAADVNSLPRFMDCQFHDCAYSEGNGPGQEAVEFVLKNQGKTYRAWHVECPIPLLKCEAATLGQKTLRGKPMAEIQDLRLQSAEG